MKHLLLTVLAFGLGTMAAEPPSQGALAISGPVVVEGWSLSHSGRVVMVDATLVNRSDWLISELSSECRARQRNKDINADVIQLGAETIGPGEQVSLWCEVKLLSLDGPWNINIVPHGNLVDAPATPNPTATPTPTITRTVPPTVEPTVTPMNTPRPTATVVVVEPTDEPIRALVPYAERSPQ